MATREMMNYSGDRVPCLNVFLPVGPGRMNDPGDVMLVQGLFNYIAEGFRSTERVGLPTRRDLPRLTGVADRKTLDAIYKFQVRWQRILLGVDGVVHPADYHGRRVELDATTRRMTITMFHQLAQEAAARMNETDYTEDLPVMFPELIKFIRRW